MPRKVDVFVGVALSKNPEHELVPPANITTYINDESLYLRAQWLQSVWTGATDSHLANPILGTQTIPAYGIIVPSRQIFVWCLIASNNANGIVAEFYYNEVKLSRAESDLLNITWGKYRR